MKERRGERRGGEAEKEYLEKKQPDSPAVCKLIAQPPITWQKREGGEKKRGGRRENNLNKHTKRNEKEM